MLASDETLAFKVLGFLGLIAGLNFFVGVFNLLPLLPAGRRAHRGPALRAGARQGQAARSATPAPLRRVDFTKLLPLTYAVVVFFAGFTVFLLGADIVNPIRLEP